MRFHRIPPSNCLLKADQQQVPRCTRDDKKAARDDTRGPFLLVHLLQSLVQKLRREVLSVQPRDRGKPVIEIELRESVAVAQWFHFLAVELVRQIDNSFASIVEFQPNLVVSEIARLNNMTGFVLISGQRVPPFRDAEDGRQNCSRDTGAGKNRRATARYSHCGRAPPAQRLHLRALISPASLRRSAFGSRPFRHCGSLSRPSPTSRSCLGPRGSVCPPVRPR